MKKTLYILLILSVALLSGCSKMLDEIAPKNQVKASLLNDSDLGKLTNGVRYRMETLTRALAGTGDWLSENYVSGPGFDVHDVHAETQAPSSSIALNDWRNCFGTLNDVNQLLVAATGTDALSVEASANAYFFRAWIYYNLVIRYGGVPLLTAPSSVVVPISAENLIWEQIISDCRRAIEILPENVSFFYPSKNAAKILLARVLLWQGQNEEAASLASEVIASGKYTLAENSEDFANMFVYGTSSKETILALANIRTSDLKLMYEQVNDVDGSWNYSPAPKYYSSLYQDDSYRTGDIRKAATFSDADHSRVIKFPNGAAGMNQFVENAKPSNSPMVLLRLADAYLIEAEALGKDAGKSVLQKFMSKRYHSVSLPAVMTDKQWQDLILEENNREFFGEGRRWFDIKRTGRVDLYDSWNGRDFLLYWPVPQKERDIAGKENYPQNPGYSD